MSIDTVNRNLSRIAALSRAVPIMVLPAEIRAIIYSQLAPIDQFKVSLNLSSRLVFNPYDAYKLGQCEYTRDIILYMYNEARLFDKIFPMLYNEYNTQGHSLTGTREFNPFKYLPRYREGKLAEYYLSMSQMCTSMVTYFYNRVYEYNIIPLKIYVIFIKFCLIKLRRDRNLGTSSYGQHVFDSYWCVDQDCILENGSSSENESSSGRESTILGGWTIYRDIHWAITVLLLSCIDNVEFTKETTEALYALLVEFYINDNNHHMSTLLQYMLNDEDFSYFDHVRYYSNEDHIAEKAKRTEYLHLLHIDYITRIDILASLETNDTISAADFMAHIIRLIEEGVITHYRDSDNDLEYYILNAQTPIGRLTIYRYGELLNNPDVRALEGFRIIKPLGDSDSDKGDVNDGSE